MAIHYRHDFHAFSTLGWTDLRASALGHRKGRVDEALFFVQHPFVAEFIGNIRQGLTQNFAVAPRLKTDDARFCSSDSFAAACATARQC